MAFKLVVRHPSLLISSFHPPQRTENYITLNLSLQDTPSACVWTQQLIIDCFDLQKNRPLDLYKSKKFLSLSLPCRRSAVVYGVKIKDRKFTNVAPAKRCGSGRMRRIVWHSTCTSRASGMQCASVFKRHAFYAGIYVNGTLPKSIMAVFGGMRDGIFHT